MKLSEIFGKKEYLVSAKALYLDKLTVGFNRKVGVAVLLHFLILIRRSVNEDVILLVSALAQKYKYIRQKQKTQT